AVLETLAEGGLIVPVVRLGIRDRVVPHGDPKAQHEELGYGPEAIARTLDELGAVRSGAGQGGEAVTKARGDWRSAGARRCWWPWLSRAASGSWAYRWPARGPASTSPWKAA